jgi:hypothetical protein
MPRPPRYGEPRELTIRRTSEASRPPAMLDPGDDLRPETDEKDDRDQGDDCDPAPFGDLAEEQVASEGEGHGRTMVEA